ncbi:MAG: M48 family metalloprotease [Nitriliruptorales bacterium]|nr:M48 family metalloprotease [Nitriliruptorales bacterium]
MSNRRGLAWWSAAGGLAIAGILAEAVRPVAPAVGEVATDLTRFSPDVLAAVGDYLAERRAAAVGALAMSVAVPAWLLLSAPGRRGMERLGAWGSPARGGGAVAGAVSAMTSLAILPFGVYAGFVHEQRWGFSTQSLLEWLRDRAIRDGLAALVAVVLAVVFVWFRRRWPDTWHLRLTLAGTALTGLLVLVYPVVIQPLLLSTQPLEAGETRTAVETVLAQAGAEDVEILVGDASRRTTKVNAFVTGIGPSRQVVLFDTLLELPPEQVAVVVAHELAHREHADVPRAVLLSATGLLAGLLLLRWWLHAERARGGRVGDAQAVVMLLLVIAAGQVVTAPAANWVSRRAEAAADHRALELTEAAGRFIATQRTFVVRDLADPTPPWWVTALWGTHPSPSDRIDAAVVFARAHELPVPDRPELVAEEPAPPEGPG